MSLFLPHFDDELFVLPYLRLLSSENSDKSVFAHIYFLSADPTLIRQKESMMTLGKLPGIQVHFLGDQLGVIDSKMALSHKIVLDYLIASKEFLDFQSDLYACHYEGGHRDHDAVFLMIRELSIKTNRKMYTFSAYNAYHPLLPVAVSYFKSGVVDGPKTLIPFDIKVGFWCLKNISNYPSQMMVLLVLLPGFLHFFLWRKSLTLIEVTTFDQNKSHPGAVFYDSMLKNQLKKLLRLS